MIVSCPQCDTTFSMPDELYKPGRKARCSQCANVFRLPETEVGAPVEAAPEGPGIVIAPPDEPPSKKVKAVREASFLKQKKQTIVLLLVLVICFAGMGYGGLMIYRSLFGAAPTATGTTDGGGVAQDGLSAEERQRIQEQEARVQSIALENVRQFIADNDTMERIVVIQGEAVNNFKTPKEFIRVEGILYGPEKKVLARSEQMGGISLTLFQLKVLTEKEMKAALSNRIAILTNNVDVKPGERVPFVVIFSSVPPDLKSFEVRVTDAQDPEK